MYLKTTYCLLQSDNWLRFVWIRLISILSCYVLVSNEQVISPSKSVTSERNVSRLLDDLDSQVLPPPRSVTAHPPAFPLAFYKLHLIFCTLLRQQRRASSEPLRAGVHPEFKLRSWRHNTTTTCSHCHA